MNPEGWLHRSRKENCRGLGGTEEAGEDSDFFDAGDYLELPHSLFSPCITVNRIYHLTAECTDLGRRETRMPDDRIRAKASHRLILWSQYSHMKSNRNRLKDLNLSPKSPSRGSTREERG